MQVKLPGAGWHHRLTSTAQADHRDVLLWTRSRFGDWHSRIYVRTPALKSREQGVETRSRAAFAPCMWSEQGAADDTSSSFGFRAGLRMERSMCCDYCMTPWICLAACRPRENSTDRLVRRLRAGGRTSDTDRGSRGTALRGAQCGDESLRHEEDGEERWEREATLHRIGLSSDDVSRWRA